MTSTATFANTNARPTSIPMPQFISQPTHVGQPEIPPLPRGVAHPLPGAPQIAIRQPPNPLGDKKGWRPFPIIKKHNEKIDSIITKIGRVGFIARGFIWAAIGVHSSSILVDRLRVLPYPLLLPVVAFVLNPKLEPLMPSLKRLEVIGS